MNNLKIYKEINNIKDILECKYYERKRILENDNCDIIYLNILCQEIDKMESELAELENKLKNNNEIIKRDPNITFDVGKIHEMVLSKKFDESNVIYINEMENLINKYSKQIKNIINKNEINIDIKIKMVTDLNKIMAQINLFKYNYEDMKNK